MVISPPFSMEMTAVSFTFVRPFCWSAARAGPPTRSVIRMLTTRIRIMRDPPGEPRDYGIIPADGRAAVRVVRWNDAAASRHSSHRDHRPRRPRKDHARRRDALAV